MLTKELIAQLAEKTGLSKKRCEELLMATTDTITDCVRSGKNVQLQGFGSLEVKETSERKLVHPKTGEAMNVAASVKLNFKPSEMLKEVFND